MATATAISGPALALLFLLSPGDRTDALGNIRQSLIVGVCGRRRLATTTVNNSCAIYATAIMRCRASHMGRPSPKETASEAGWMACHSGGSKYTNIGNAGTKEACVSQVKSTRVTGGIITQIDKAVWVVLTVVLSTRDALSIYANFYAAACLKV
jgi:hypothetical protein